VVWEDGRGDPASYPIVLGLEVANLQRRVVRVNTTAQLGVCLAHPGGVGGRGRLFWVAMDTMPGLFAKVRLQDRGKVYLVVNVDPVQQLVKLISTSGMPHEIPDVPIDAIHELVEGPPDRP